MKHEEKKKNDKELQALLTFLKKTKDGKYAEVDRKVDKYSRLRVQTEEQTEVYYHSLS